MVSKQNRERDTPGVVAPPPLIFLGGLLPGGMIEWFYRGVFFPPDHLLTIRIIGGLVIAVGLGIILTAKVKMHRAETNIEPWKPTTSIISDGIYSYSRNPVYLAMILMYFGVTLILNSLWFLPFLIPVLFVMHFGVIVREENYLEKKFGEEYLSYKKSVRRWI
jgi:protein-S-isoprenylcysteine O-methyltransferase Ste14